MNNAGNKESVYVWQEQISMPVSAHFDRTKAKKVWSKDICLFSSNENF